MLALGIAGHGPALTAWRADQDRPRKGCETIVVAAGHGPVGATVGRIGKLLGCVWSGSREARIKCAYGC